MAFEYPSEKTADTLQDSVNKTADWVGTAIIDWSNPHIYRSGELIVVYLGKKPEALETLAALLGPHFAPR